MTEYWVLNVYSPTQDERLLCSIRLARKPGFIPPEDDEYGEYPLDMHSEAYEEVGILHGEAGVGFTVEKITAPSTSS